LDLKQKHFQRNRLQDQEHIQVHQNFSILDLGAWIETREEIYLRLQLRCLDLEVMTSRKNTMGLIIEEQSLEKKIQEEKQNREKDLFLDLVSMRQDPTWGKTGLQ